MALYLVKITDPFFFFFLSFSLIQTHCDVLLRYLLIWNDMARSDIVWCGTVWLGAERRWDELFFFLFSSLAFTTVDSKLSVAEIGSISLLFFSFHFFFLCFLRVSRLLPSIAVGAWKCTRGCVVILVVARKRCLSCTSGKTLFLQYVKTISRRERSASKT